MGYNATTGFHSISENMEGSLDITNFDLNLKSSLICLNVFYTFSIFIVEIHIKRYLKE